MEIEISNSKAYLIGLQIANELAGHYVLIEDDFPTIKITSIYGLGGFYNHWLNRYIDLVRDVL